ncbi:unnamed protein product [Durusdinium trenchii]|uniref:Ubiquitin-like domain-containing protein n=1 Tax=Durusdinium trenchii TaxID=1381693 RepID=A0ABP0QXA4_9DINO
MQRQSPFFQGTWEGYRNDWDGEFGFRFLAEATFVITSLGRYVTPDGLEEETTVTLWAADSQKKLAVATVGSNSTVLDCYAYSEVFPRVVARLGKEYRLTQSCHRGMKDPWPDGHYSMEKLSQRSSSFARYLGGAYDCHGGFPAFCDAEEGRRAGMLNFKVISGIASVPFHPSTTVYELKQQLEAVTGVPPIQQELSCNLKPLSKNSETLSSEGVTNGELLILAVRAGSLAITASRDATARLWSVDSGECVRIFSGHSDAVLDVDFAPSGSSVLTASKDCTARIWMVETGECCAKLEGHTGAVVSAAFAPSGAQVVTASQDHTARVWTVDGTCSHLLDKHLGAVVAASFSPDGSRIITASTDCTARVWEPTFGDALLNLKGHSGGVILGKISPDGSQILTVAIDTQGVCVRDAASGSVLKRLADGQSVHDAAFSPDGHHIMAACYDWKCRIWSTETFEILQEMAHDAQVVSCRFSADGSFAVTICANQMALVWRVLTGELVHRLGHSGPVATASFSPDSTRMVTGEDCRGRVWDVVTGRCSVVLVGHRARLEAALVSP